jgi:hypothetical protein
LEHADNGNGAPGLKEMAKDHERRLREIEGETEEEDDWAGGVEASLEDHNESITTIETLHKAEREAVEKVEKKKEVEAESMRKFRWSMIYFGVTALIDLLLKLAGLPR